MRARRGKGDNESERERERERERETRDLHEHLAVARLPRQRAELHAQGGRRAVLAQGRLGAWRRRRGERGGAVVPSGAEGGKGR